MTTRQFNIASFVSVLLAGCTTILCLATLLASSRDYRLSLAEHFRIGVCPYGDETFRRLAAFSDAHGPYLDGIMWGESATRFKMAGDWGITVLGGMFFLIIKSRLRVRRRL